MNKKSVMYSTVFMVVLAFILTFVLASLNSYTKPIVSFNAKVEKQSKILYVFGIKPENNDGETISKTFDKYVEEEDYKDGFSLYKYKENGEVVAYAVPFDGPGLWGNIEGYVGIDANLSKIVGVDFIKQDETPGLGGRIAEDSYKEQFRSIDISKASEGKYIINHPASGGNIDAISGATQTSNFVVKMINEDLQKFIDERRGVK